MNRTPPDGPVVSVVIPVWNVEPWLRQCLDSVLGQSIGRERLEIVAVDDGSTDGSGAILDEYAAREPAVRVLHQPNSGGPGAPRNAGVEAARGTYVYFLDGDDYLGEEALERTVAMAERNGSDIVLGRLVGIDGRRAYRETGVFGRNRDRAEVELVYRSGNALKLFRRAMLLRAGLRFPEGIAGGEDDDFMARAYNEAGTISVVADYACYYTRRRVGSQTTGTTRRDDIAATIARIEQNRILPVVQHARGVRRDLMLGRQVRKIAATLGSGWTRRAPAERRAAFDAAAGVLDRWWSPRLMAGMPAWAAIRVHCLRHGLLAELEAIAAVNARDAFGDPIVEGGRLYARYPHFRDASGIPDRCFDITDEVAVHQRIDTVGVEDGRLAITGEAYLNLVGGTTEVELARWPRGPRHRAAATIVPTPLLTDGRVPYPQAGFEAAIDLATAAGGSPLPRGTWTIRLVTGTASIRRSVDLRRAPATRLTPGRAGRDGGTLTRAPDRSVRLRVGRPSLLDRVMAGTERIVARIGRLGRRMRARLAGGTPRRATPRWRA